MKKVTINCEFSDFLMTLAKTFRFCEEPDSEDCFQVAKDNLFTYRKDEHGCEYEEEITDEELIELYHEEVEIQLSSMHYACASCDLVLTFHKHCNLQFMLTCYNGNPIYTTFKTLYELLG